MSKATLRMRQVSTDMEPQFLSADEREGLPEGAVIVEAWYLGRHSVTGEMNKKKGLFVFEQHVGWQGGSSDGWEIIIGKVVEDN